MHIRNSSLVLVPQLMHTTLELVGYLWGTYVRSHSCNPAIRTACAWQEFPASFQYLLAGISLAQEKTGFTAKHSSAIMRKESLSTQRHLASFTQALKDNTG